MQQHYPASPITRTPPLVGTWRRFGEAGPVYEILAETRDRQTMRIRVIESGEELDYRVAQILTDPPAD